MALQVIIPTGAVMGYAGPTEPTGWLFCDGRALSRTGTYAGLYAAIGTTYGSGLGDGLTFSLPDLRGRGSVGPDNMGAAPISGVTTMGAASVLAVDSTRVSAVTAGTKIGQQKHTLQSTETAMIGHSHGGTTGDQDRTHSHTFTTSTNGDHAHSLSGYPAGGFSVINRTTGAANFQAPVDVNGRNTSTNGAHSHTGTTDAPNTGHLHPFTTTTNPADAPASTGHSNVQPSLIMNKIIKT